MNQTLAGFAAILAEIRPLKDELRPDLRHLRLHLTLINGTTLHIRENRIISTGWVDYSYHWQTADHQLIHRWDNAHERQSLQIPLHHQQVGFEENIQPSEPMTLEAVLRFIAVQLSHDSSSTSN